MREMIINIELIFGYLASQLKSKDQTGIPNHEMKSAKQNDFMILNSQHGALGIHSALDACDVCEAGPWFFPSSSTIGVQISICP